MGKKPTDLLSPLTLHLKENSYTIGLPLGEDAPSGDGGLPPLGILGSQDPLDFVVNLSSSPYTIGKNETLQRRFAREAAALHVPIFYVNHVGVQNNGKTVYPFNGDRKSTR